LFFAFGGFTDSWSQLLPGVFTWVQTFAFFCIASNLLQDIKFSKTVLRTYAIATVMLTLAFWLRLPGFSEILMQGSGGERVSTLGANPNYLGMVLAVAVVIL